MARYIGRHGTKRVAKAVLIGAVPPLMLKTAANPGGLPIEVFDEIRAGVLADRSQFFKDLSAPFYGANRPARRSRRACATRSGCQGMQAGFKGAFDCIKAFSETDFTEDLKKFDVPTLIMHGDDDQIVPIGASAPAVVEARQGRHAEGLPGRAARHRARRTRTRSTRTCSRSSRSNRRRETPMIWGMSTETFTLVHVLISLAGIASGLIVVFGLVAGKRLDGWTVVFLLTTAATSIIGFGFPFEHLSPAHKLGIVSLVVLAVVVYARYARHLAGRWRRIYVIGVAIALYLNVFVGVVQAFMKVPPLAALAPHRNEPPFLVAQLIVLLLFVVLTIVAARRFV